MKTHLRPAALQLRANNPHHPDNTHTQHTNSKKCFQPLLSLRPNNPKQPIWNTHTHTSLLDSAIRCHLNRFVIWPIMQLPTHQVTRKPLLNSHKLQLADQPKRTQASLNPAPQLMQKHHAAPWETSGVCAHACSQEHRSFNSGPSCIKHLSVARCLLTAVWWHRRQEKKEEEQKESFSC